MAFVEIPLVVTVAGTSTVSAALPALWLFVTLLVALSGYLLWKRSQSF